MHARGAVAHLHLAMQRWQVCISAHNKRMDKLAGVDINQMYAHLQTHSTLYKLLAI
jgi:hypothetical protein